MRALVGGSMPIREAAPTGITGEVSIATTAVDWTPPPVAGCTTVRAVAFTPGRAKIRTWQAPLQWMFSSQSSGLEDSTRKPTYLPGRTVLICEGAPPSVETIEKRRYP